MSGIEKNMRLLNRLNNKPTQDKTKPSHYHDAGGDDWIGFAMRHKVGAIEFNIGKYILRHNKKNGKEDLLKAQEYLKRLIDSYE